MRADWLEEFSRRLDTGHSKQLLTLIGRIRPAHAEVGRALEEWVRIHQLDKFIPVVQGALKDRENG